MAVFISYYRVSTDRQGRSGLGLDAQRQAVAQFVGAGQVGGTVWWHTRPVFSPFGTTDHQFTGLHVVVGNMQGDTLGTPQTGTIKNRDESGVTNSGRRSIAATRVHQSRDFTRRQRATTRRRLRLDGGHVGDTVVLFRGHVAETPRFLQDAA